MSPTRALLGVITILGPLGATESRERGVVGGCGQQGEWGGPGSRASSRGWCPRHWLLLRSSKRAHPFPHPSRVPPSIFPTAPFCAPPQLGSRDSVAHRNAWLPEFVGHTRQWGRKITTPSIIVPSVQLSSQRPIVLCQRSHRILLPGDFSESLGGGAWTVGSCRLIP